MPDQSDELIFVDDIGARQGEDKVVNIILNHFISGQASDDLRDGIGSGWGVLNSMLTRKVDDELVDVRFRDLKCLFHS
ncbi:MAG: hypothetical protein B7X44_06520 [Halothiobacillus sp. 15-55-196]|nr:MAG: hypothetical protein B7X44_06520 [Halothiobacillus sp. 15-55-196]